MNDAIFVKGEDGLLPSIQSFRDRVDDKKESKSVFLNFDESMKKRDWEKVLDAPLRSKGALKPKK